MVEGGVHQSHRDLWPWQKEVIGLLDSSLLEILELSGTRDCGSCCGISAAWQQAQTGTYAERC